MAVIEIKCPHCKTLTTMNVGQNHVNERVRYYGSCRCSHCGAVWEEDGTEPTPEYIRNAIIEQEGKWELEIQADANQTIVIKELRNLLNLSLEEVLQIKRALPGVVFAGTNAEAHKIGKPLFTAGINETSMSIRRAKYNT